MDTKKYVVAGSGFRGFCDALELSKIPNSEVTIIEPAPFFGGLMHSLDIKGFSVDKGVHMFDSIPVELAAIVNEIMEDKTDEIDFISKSSFNNIVTDGFSLPDLNSLTDEATKNKIKEEILSLESSSVTYADAENLEEYFSKRYGKTAGKIFCDIFLKVYGISAHEVEPNAIERTSMGRLKFLDDDEMLELKGKSSNLDNILAARRKSMGKVDDLVSIYPNDGLAMKGWCIKAKPWLEAKGIKVLLGEKITDVSEESDQIKITTNKGSYSADKLIWSNDNIQALVEAMKLDTININDYLHGAPMLFITMMTEKENISNFTYLQNFDPDAVTYRTAAAGIFSHQEENGVSFITSECPVVIDSKEWNNPDIALKAAWEEAKRLKIVSENANLVDSHVLKLPSTFKLSKVNFTKNMNLVIDQISNHSKKVVLRNDIPFFRRDVYKSSLSLKELV